MANLILAPEEGASDRFPGRNSGSCSQAELSRLLYRFSSLREGLEVISPWPGLERKTNATNHGIKVTNKSQNAKEQQ